MFYIDIKYMIYKDLVDTFLNEPVLISFAAKWFQVLIFNTNNSLYD